MSDNRPNMMTDEALKQKRMRAEHMHDVSLLLEDLFRSQESTVKLIFDRLYDIASVHLIDQKLSARPLNRITKAIAPGMKPVFRVVGLIWFKKKCPALVTNWLYKKVTSGQLLPQLLQELQEFEEAELKLVAQGRPTPAEGKSALPAVRRRSDRILWDQSTQEIRRLRSQVQFLLGALVGTVMLLGSATLWFMRDSMPLLMQPTDSSAAACLNHASCRESGKETVRSITPGDR